jgi:hypothetical protein
VDAEGAGRGAKGTDWTAEQVAVVVANYFLMLERERAGDKVNKADLYRRLSPEVGRSDKSIEWKLRNVSAVLDELGMPGSRGAARPQLPGRAGGGRRGPVGTASEGSH